MSAAARWFRSGVVVTALLSVPAAAQSQPPAARTEMTVDELVARALADNPDLRATRAEVEGAVGRVQQAGLRPNPMLELGGQKALGPDNNLMVGFTWPLDRGGRKEGRVGVAERELDTKRAQVLERERRLVADVRLKAGEYFASRRNLAVTDGLLGANRDALRLVRDRIREGAVPAIDENLMLVEVNRLEANRHVQASRVEVAALQLRLLAGMGPETPLSLRGDLATTATPPDRSEALRRALAARPDLAGARAEAATSRARIRKEEAEGRWDASVNVGYQRQDFGFMLSGLSDSGAVRPIQDVFHYFGAGVSITLPVRNRNQGNIAAAQAEARAADRRVEFMELMARQEIDAAFAQYAAVQRSLAIYERGVRDVASRNLDVVRQTYDLGRTSLLDVVAEQRRYIEIENGYTEALRQVYDAVVEIGRAAGHAGR
jgi:cobalt-zinc-cadmium efflux system outer membrane protein